MSLGAPEHFPERWTPVFRRKCDQATNLERVPELELDEACSTCSERALGRALRLEARMDHCAVTGERGRLDDLVIPFDGERSLVDQDLEERIEVLGIEARGGGREPARHVEKPDDLDAARVDH